MLYGNPHFPWSGSERFFQAQLTVPGKINVSGASLLGAPVVLIGHTQKLAWSHTVSSARRFSAFRESLVPGQPTRYLVDGQARDMEETEVSVDVKQPDDSIQTETRTLYSTIHGPVFNSVQKTPLFPWTADYAYTIFDPNSQGLRFINHFFDTNRAQSVGDLRDALVKNQGVPWVNTIAADSKGKSLYADIGAIPDIDQDRVDECGTPGLGDIAWASTQVGVLDGTRPECDMKKAPGAVAKGIIPPDEMPLLIRDDYVSNMNDSYWLTNPEQPLEGFSRIIGNERSARSLRTRNGLNQIEQRLAGTDGIPGNKYTPQLLREFITNNRHYGAELWVDPLVEYCQANPIINTVDVSEACGVLANYGETENLDDPGAVLWRRVMGAPPAACPVAFENAFSLGDPVHTPNGLDTARSGCTEGALGFGHRVEQPRDTDGCDLARLPVRHPQRGGHPDPGRIRRTGSVQRDQLDPKQRHRQVRLGAPRFELHRHGLAGRQEVSGREDDPDLLAGCHQRVLSPLRRSDQAVLGGGLGKRPLLRFAAEEVAGSEGHEAERWRQGREERLVASSGSAAPARWAGADGAA